MGLPVLDKRYLMDMQKLPKLHGLSPQEKNGMERFTLL